MLGVPTAETLLTIAMGRADDATLEFEMNRIKYPPALQDGWSFADGLFSIELPTVTSCNTYASARHAAFPPEEQFGFRYRTRWLMAIGLYNLYEYMPYNRRPMNMQAYWVGVHFHHWMGRHIPGFWNAMHWSETNRIEFRRQLCFKNQCTITFLGFGKGFGIEHGAPILYVTDRGGKQRNLIYRCRNDDLSGENCYPEHLDSEHRFACWDLPNRETRKAITDAFALVAAIS